MYEIALVNLETYNSIPNITKENNEFRYSNDNGKSWKRIVLEEGCYELKDIADAIHDKMPEDERRHINISASGTTLKSMLHLGRNYWVDFSSTSSIGSVLGFDPMGSENNHNVLSSGNHESQNIVNIKHVNSILVNIDIISGSYVNGTLQPVIYSFFPNVPPGYKIVENPKNLVYLPLILDKISSIETRLTDQNDKLLNFRGEEITMRFHIREV